MLIERLDRTAWKLEQAREHIAGEILPTLPEEPWLTEPGSSHQPPWQHSRSPQERADEEARRELLVALRDGDLHATGRLSTRQTSRWHATSLGWELHSGHPSHITPEQWRGGQMEWRSGALTMIDGQFIDIRVPRFAVHAIWPKAETAPAALGDYTTPYLDLLHRAIAECRITEAHQEKKDVLVMWFRQQEVEGEPLSENLANAMATLVRLPASQRGGAKRASNW
jgi:hypothetical protein